MTTALTGTPSRSRRPPSPGSWTAPCPRATCGAGSSARPRPRPAAPCSTARTARCARPRCAWPPWVRKRARPRAARAAQPRTKWRRAWPHAQPRWPASLAPARHPCCLGPTRPAAGHGGAPKPRTSCTRPRSAPGSRRRGFWPSPLRRMGSALRRPTARAWLTGRGYWLAPYTALRRRCSRCPRGVRPSLGQRRLRPKLRAARAVGPGSAACPCRGVGAGGPADLCAPEGPALPMPSLHRKTAGG
mmetsp:Transcript_65603/g.211657  ORF Transcript_65603/g.211657 Transcript_65603/m.211657 type:complete len:245 (-) Transcript_65603:15-749(-)